MKPLECQHEPAVLRAFKTGNWNDFTQAHFQSCALCQERAEIGRWLQAFAAQTDQEAPRTAYGPIWLKAQFQSRQRAEKQVLRPLRIFRTAAEILAALAFLAVSLLSWPLLKTRLADFSIAALGNSPAILMSFLGLLFLFATFFFTVNSFAQED
ncbi:hypothetical protein HUU05_18105 [candidate division KSB1 bacterium]|nr:hypothetical protein [candidate division KSB1 bacterium]